MTMREDFEKWWDSQGQFCRAGGGDYEKTFAFRAYEAASLAAAEKVKEEAARVCEHNRSRNDHIHDVSKECAAAIRAINLQKLLEGGTT